jgi:hypothetical protein
VFNKTSILLFIFLGLLASVSLGQRSANASMQISAKVIKPVGISSSSQLPNKVEVNTQTAYTKGMLKLQGTEQQNTIVEVPNTIDLISEEGNVIKLDIQLLDTISEEEKEISYHLNNSPNEHIKNGKYNGNMSTTVVYF